MLTEVNEAALLIQGIIDPSANIIFGQTIDDSLSDEVKITVIATGFTSKEDEVRVEVKPTFKFNENVVDSTVPPLLREIEAVENATQQQPVEEAPQPVVQEQVAAQKIEVEPQPETKGKELPAFMRKLFRK